MPVLRWLAVLIAGCAGNPPPPGVVVSAPERDGHPCDPTSKRRVTPRVAGADVLFEEITTEYLCPEVQTHTTELGRISLSARSAHCPVGELVLRTNGGSTSAPTGFEATLAPTERAELRGALSQAAGYDNAEAYVLGCGSKHTADFVFVQTGVHATHVSFLVKNRSVMHDRRFLWSDPARR